MKAEATHDYTQRYWGHDFAITDVKNGGQQLKLCGWGPYLEKGDFILLPNGADSTRYKLLSVRYESNPPDMWWADAEFAPRPRPTDETYRALDQVSA